MGLVVSDMSMSLDGYIAGPNAGVDNPHLAPVLLGGGIRLFDGVRPNHIEL